VEVQAQMLRVIERVERQLPSDFSSSCLGFGLDDFGGALANAFIILPEAVRLVVVADLAGALACSGILL